MSHKTNKQNKDDILHANSSSSSTKKDSSNALIGNKRIRPKTQEQSDSKKICIYCNKASTSDFLEFNDSTPNQNIINYINKKLKDENFKRILSENINMMIKTDNKNQNAINNIICDNCFLNYFISGGLDKIFNSHKAELNQSQDSTQSEEIITLKKLFDLYSINIRLSINKLKDLKSKYSLILKNTKNLFDISIQIMINSNKEVLQCLKRNMDECLINLKEIDISFESLINDLSSKEDLQKSIAEGANINDISNKNNLLPIFKKMENNAKINNFNLNDFQQGLNNELYQNTIKNKDMTNCNLDKKNDNKNKESNDDEIKNLYNKTNTLNKINNRYMQDIQNQISQNSKEILNTNLEKSEFLINNLLSSLTRNDIKPNISDSPFISNLGYGPFDIPISRIQNDFQFNNLLNSELNPQILNQINNNNNCQISSYLGINNSLNDNNNNLNNLSYSNPFIQRANLYNNFIDPSKNLEIKLLNNIMNKNTSNNWINNLYNSQINPNILNNYNTSSLYNNNNFLSIHGNNSIPNISQTMNNNDFTQSKINQLNLIGKERMNINNLSNSNNNKQGVNLNSMSNNNNSCNINNLSSLNGLSNKTIINETNNSNLNKVNQSQNINNNILYQGQDYTSKDYHKMMLLQLFNNIAKEKEKKNFFNLELHNNKNSNVNANNNQAELSTSPSKPLEQNKLNQINPYIFDMKDRQITVADNNNNMLNNAGKLECIKFQNNIQNINRKNNVLNNEKEILKK